jgi:DNA replication and repair protein RecF
MYLKNLSLLNFKNYSEISIDFCPEINCFTGNNGEGKTNLLDAIYYLSFCKSYFNALDSQNIKHNEPFFVIQGEFFDNNSSHFIYCGQKRGQKKVFKRNKKEYDRLANHIGLFPVVMISPYDTELINEGSDVRRKFIDTIISQFNKQYLDNLIQYNKILFQRNNLLKNFWEKRYFDATSLEVWDEQLIPMAEYIYKERAIFIEEFHPIFKKFYAEISGSKEEAAINYLSDLSIGSFSETLGASLEKDKQRSYTNVGIHKDEMEFLLNDVSIKKFGSQGQQKSFLIALKLAQFDFIREKKNVKPLLLLDDIFDKIDENRVKYLMQLVSTHLFGQIFITDTDPNRILSIFKDIDVEVKAYYVEEGELNISTSNLKI